MPSGELRARVMIPETRFTPVTRAANALRGDVSTDRTGPLSTIRPCSTTITRSATASASRRSCVTITAVRASSRRMCRNSRRSAGAAVTSRADIGSSRSSTFGSAASARATATRCAWPPDSCAGRRSASSWASTAASHRSAMTRASERRFPLLRGAKATFAATLMWGNSIARWDSMATPREWAGTNTPLPVSVSTRLPSSTLPWSGRSRPAISSSSVDLPAPLGPSTASTSPSASVRSNATPRSSMRACTRRLLTVRLPAGDPLRSAPPPRRPR